MQKITRPRSYRHSMLRLYTRIVWLTLGAAIVGVGIMMTDARAGASHTTDSKRLGATTRLEDLLNPDGTLDQRKKFVGSIDARGWRLVSGPDEAPRFASAGAPGDDAWVPYFGMGSTDGTVNALALDGNGNLYVGGYFLTVTDNISATNSITVNYIARWNGSRWSSLGNGVNGEVIALAVDSLNNVYAGGGFSEICLNSACSSGMIANYIAKWDGSGSGWSTMSSGMSSWVYALAVDSMNNVYAGGDFLQAGGSTVNHIAKWNGSWSALNSGVSSGIRALTAAGTTIYAGGYFTQTCGNANCDAGNFLVSHIVGWDGNGAAWLTLGSGLNKSVSALAVDSGGGVYAGGVFTQSSLTTLNYIAKWDGTGWLTMSSGMSDPVSALAVDSVNNVYAGGSFTNAGGNNVNFVAKWDGINWSALGNGMNCCVNALTVDSGNNIYAGGSFTHVCGNSVCNSGNTTVNHIAEWHGSSWSGLSKGVNSSVEDMAQDSAGNIYAGGVFAQTGLKRVNHIAKWDGNSWSALGNGTNNIIYAVAIDHLNNVYAGGVFSAICGNVLCNTGNITVNRIAKYDGSWHILGNGLNGAVYALAVDSGNNVYAGGLFTQYCTSVDCSTGTIVNYIAKWNGSAWSPLGNGMNNSVTALAVDGSDNLYAGGTFTQTGVTVVNRIAKWNGSWLALGNGVNNSVDALAVDYANNVYAGGAFTAFCGNPPCNIVTTAKNYIAKWNGSSWSGLASGLNFNVYALAVDSANNLYAGGGFTEVCGNFSCNSGNTSASYIAKWNGSSWSALGSGVDDIVNALAVRGRALFAGGDFQTAGGKSSEHIGEYFLTQLFLPIITK